MWRLGGGFRIDVGILLMEQMQNPMINAFNDEMIISQLAVPVV